MQRSCDVEISVTVERQALWTAQPAIENARLTAFVEPSDHFKAGNGRSAHVKSAVGPESQMICRHRGFVLRPRTRFANLVNLMDCSGAISDEHLAVAVERHTGRNAKLAGEYDRFFQSGQEI